MDSDNYPVSQQTPNRRHFTRSKEAGRGGECFHLVGMRSENFEDGAGLVVEELA